MFLAFQHFDFNSANWFSNNLHVSTSWNVQTMGKEFKPLVSVDISGAGTHYEPLRKSAWEVGLEKFCWQNLEQEWAIFEASILPAE